jgi:hypothetical protein
MELFITTPLEGETVAIGYDLNIWDMGGHMSDYEEGSEAWRITLHKCVRLPDGSYQTGDHLPDYLDLTAEEARQLTLGWSKELGGMYCADEDFFLDPAGFLDIYKGAVPERVREWVERYNVNEYF